VQPNSSEGVMNYVRCYLMLSRAVLLAHKVYDTLIESPRQLFNSLFESIFLLEYSILEYFFNSLFNDKNKK
jgi:hypothetical protein